MQSNMWIQTNTGRGSRYCVYEVGGSGGVSGPVQGTAVNALEGTRDMREPTKGSTQGTIYSYTHPGRQRGPVRLESRAFQGQWTLQESICCIL